MMVLVAVRGAVFAALVLVLDSGRGAILVR